MEKKVKLPMVDEGDCGALVLTEDGKIAGMLFAEYSNYKFLNKKEVIEKKLEGCV